MTRRFSNKLGSTMLGSALCEVRQYMVNGAQHIVRQAPNVQELMGSASKTMSANMRATMHAAKEHAAEATYKATNKATAGVKSSAEYAKKEAKSIWSSYDIRRPLKYAAGSVAFETVQEYNTDSKEDPFKGQLNELEKNTIGLYEKALKTHQAVASGDATEIDKLRHKYPVAAAAVDVAKPVIGTEGAITLGIAFSLVTSEGPASLVHCARAGTKLAVNSALHPVLAEEKIMSFADKITQRLMSHSPVGAQNYAQTPQSTPTVQKPKGLGGGMELD